MRRNSETAFHFLLTVLIVVLVHACSTGPDPRPPLQTHILEVRVEPNPVTVGDTATFTCIIEDSLDERFKFEWLFAGNSFEDTTTQTNEVYWIAQGEPNIYDNHVKVDNGSPDSVAPGRTFTFEVIEN